MWTFWLPVPQAREEHYPRNEMHAACGGRPKKFDALAPEVIHTGDEVQIPPAAKPKISSASRACCGTIAAAMTSDIVANTMVAAVSRGVVAGTKDTARSATKPMLILSR
jgi:hypothetical protein